MLWACGRSSNARYWDALLETLPVDVEADWRATTEVRRAAEQFFHAAGALHGSVYFKMLDDAAFFAEAVLHDSEGNQIGRGSGVFVRSKLPLSGTRGYST